MLAADEQAPETLTAEPATDDPDFVQRPDGNVAEGHLRFPAKHPKSAHPQARMEKLLLR